MPQTALTAVPQTYAALRAAVEVAMVKGQQAVELARVRTYHETGRLIHEHVLLFKERADYGTQTIPRLAGDLKLDRSVLLRCVQFYRAFPIVATWRQLTWAHYRTLIPVADVRQRRALATEANRNVWSVVQLEQRIRTLLPTEPADAGAPDNAVARLTLLAQKCGTPGVCKVISAGNGLVLDLGFATYRDMPDDAGYKANEFVKLDAIGRLTAATAATKADLFTYSATVLKVVDGDTLWVKVYLEPGRWVKQKLRLRDLDCPEMDTAEGKAAKRFTEALVACATAMTICTTKPDKYDRYLADVFVPGAGGEPVYLNNALLAAGHATVKREWEFGDWGEA